MGAATSKLNKHFPFVISTMMSNNPLIRTKWLKRRFFEKFPDDLRPGPGVAIHRPLQHRDRDAGAAGAVVLPRWLADGDRGVRHGLLPLRHPVRDPDGCAVGVERVHDLLRGDAVRRPRRTSAFPIMTTPLPVVLFVAAGHHRGARQPVPAQDLVPARHAVLRRQLGHVAGGASSRRPTRRSSVDSSRSPACRPPSSRRSTAARRQAMIYLYKGYAFRGFNSHGKALLTLVHNALAGRNEDDVRDHRRRAALQHRRGLELRRRPHAQRAVDHRDAGAVPLRTRRGARHPARRATDSTGSVRSTGWSTPRQANSSAAT